MAQDYSLYVGEYAFVATPDPPYNGYVTSATWERDTYIGLDDHDEAGATFYPTHYFEGTQTLTCNYVFRYTSYGHEQVGSLRKTFYIACKPVNATLSSTEIKLAVGEKKKLTYSLSYTGYSSYTNKYITWKSTNENIAEVDENGNVTGVGVGGCSIILDPVGGPEVSCHVTVEAIPPTGISLPSTASCYIDGNVTLTPTFTPKYSSSDLSWWSDNNNIATVNSSGVVTGKSSGNVKIWVKTVTGGYTASCNVSVSEPPFTFEASSPKDGEHDVSTISSIKASFSLSLFKGVNFNNIRLLKDGSSVKGDVSINDRILVFRPTEELSSHSNYRLYIPANALQNKWGTPYSKDVSVSFKTGLNPADVKFIVFWWKDGRTTGISLEEHPVITYDTQVGKIICETSGTTYELEPLKDIHKYTLETDKTPQTGIHSVKSDSGHNGRLKYEVGSIVFDGFSPSTQISVYNVNGVLIERRYTSENGIFVLQTKDWQNGVYIIKANKTTIKYLKK